MAYTTVINVQDPPPPPSRFSRFLDKRAAAIISASVFLFFACASPEITTAPSDPSGPSGSGDGGGAELEALSISSAGFSVDVSSYVYPKSFSPERKYYLAPYPRGEAGAVYFNFKVKSGAVLSEVLLDGRPLNAGSGGSYAAPVVSGSLGRSVEIKVGGAASSVSYYIDMEPFSTSQSGMREVPLVKEGGAFTIGAQYVSDAYFAHVEFNGLGRLEKVLFSDVRAAALEGGGVLEIRPEGSVLPSKWAAAEDGSVRVLDGDPEITAVFTGPRYYYDYLYVKDEVEDLASGLKARADALEVQMENLMKLMVSLSDAQEELIEEKNLEPIETVYAGGVYTAAELADEYKFLYFKIAGASAYRAVLLSELETGPVSYDGASFSLVNGDLRVEAAEEGDSLAADSLEKLYGGSNEEDYRTLKAMEEQITLMYDLLHGDYVTAAMLKEGYYDKSEMDALMAVNAQAIAALEAALGVGEDLTVAARVTALETALADVKDRVSDLETDLENLSGAVDEIKVKNVGNITKSNCDNLNSFVSKFGQPANTTYYGYVSAVADIDKLPESSTGFITCETGSATNIVRQIYRPAAKAIVYERFCNNGTWGSWTRTDVASIRSATLFCWIDTNKTIVLSNPSGISIPAGASYRATLYFQGNIAISDPQFVSATYDGNFFNAPSINWGYGNPSTTVFWNFEATSKKILGHGSSTNLTLSGSANPLHPAIGWVMANWQ